MEPRDVYGNKWSLFITKVIVDLVAKEQYSVMIIFYQRNITFELRAKNGQHCNVIMWLGAFVTYTLLMCPKLTQYQTHKHYIAGSTKPWSPSASWVRGISMGGPIALWAKDYNGFCDVSCGPLQRLAWLKAVSHNGTCSDHQMSQENLFGKMILKLITYFTQLIKRATDACKVTLQVIAKKG